MNKRTSEWIKAGVIAVVGFTAIGVLMAIGGSNLDSPSDDGRSAQGLTRPGPPVTSVPTRQSEPVPATPNELQAWVTTAQPSVSEAQAAIQAMAEAASTGDFRATTSTCRDRRTRVLNAQAKVLSAPSTKVDLNYRRMMGAVTGALTDCQLGNLEETQRGLERIQPAMDAFLQSIILD